VHNDQWKRNLRHKKEGAKRTGTPAGKDEFLDDGGK